jgi:hypothetical protein
MALFFESLSCARLGDDMPVGVPGPLRNPLPYLKGKLFPLRYEYLLRRKTLTDTSLKIFHLK